MSAALSPSRAADFMQCPLLYRFRVIDRLPEPSSAAQVRGTLVHAALERLFDAPAAERTVERAVELLQPEWERLVAESPDFAEFVDEAGAAAAAPFVQRWFELEQPQYLEPAERELYVETEVDGLTLRGYVDRLDVAPDGRMRIVDYKTGRSPSERFEGQALFQMKFYALILWHLRGTLPAMLQLVYLKDGQILRFEPQEHELRATERKIQALWEAISRATATGDWRPRPSRLCNWCAHQDKCPAFGGTPPPLPDPTDSSEPTEPAESPEAPQGATEEVRLVSSPTP